MKKLRLVFLLFLLPGLSLHAKPLELDESYQLFGGGSANLKQTLGTKPLYLKFWATWCLDCRRELPNLQRAYEQYQDKIAIYAVNLNINETDEYIRRLQQKHNLTIPILMDNQGSLAGNFKFHGTPFHVLINAQGNVVYTTYNDDANLQQQLLQLADMTTDATVTQDAAEKSALPFHLMQKGPALVYFAATWCDWYMQDIHPEMATNCTSATQILNRIHKQYPKLALQSYVTHLWTEPADVKTYQEKFSITYPVHIDSNNVVARQLKSSQYPSLLLFNNGKEVNRFEKFTQEEVILGAVKKLLNQH